MARRLALLILAAVVALAGCGGGMTTEATDGTGSEVAWDHAPGPSAPSGDLDAPLAVAPGSTAGSREAVTGPAAAEQAGPAAEGALDRPLPDPPAHVDRAVDEPEPAPVAIPASNPWTDAAVDPASTFGLDVDTISYSRIREAVDLGRAIDPEGVRVEEVVNALDYDYDITGDAVFTPTADGAVWPWGRDEASHVLRVGLATAPVEVRRPADLTFVIDTSGSMAPYLALVKDSLHVLVDTLAPGRDRVSIVTYGSGATTLLPPTDVAEEPTITAAIDLLETSGSTNLAAGMVLGYQQAQPMLDPDDRTERVVLLSDGIANTGETDGQAILDLVADGTGSGIELLAVGFGSEGFNDPLMELLADRGDGVAVYVDGPQEAREVFARDLAATRQTVARQARAQVAFDPKVVEAYRLVGYENRDVADEDFRDDTVDGGEVHAGHAVTAIWEVRLAPAAAAAARDREVARLHLRWLDPATGDPREATTGIPLAAIDRPWDDAPAGLRIAATAAAWAEVLRGSPFATTRDVHDLADEATRLAAALDRPTVDEWARLVVVTTHG